MYAVIFTMIFHIVLDRIECKVLSCVKKEWSDRKPHFGLDRIEYRMPAKIHLSKGLTKSLGVGSFCMTELTQARSTLFVWQSRANFSCNRSRESNCLDGRYMLAVFFWGRVRPRVVGIVQSAAKTMHYSFEWKKSVFFSGQFFWKFACKYLWHLTLYI